MDRTVSTGIGNLFLQFKALLHICILITYWRMVDGRYGMMARVIYEWLSDEGDDGMKAVWEEGHDMKMVFLRRLAYFAGCLF